MPADTTKLYLYSGANVVPDKVTFDSSFFPEHCVNENLKTIYIYGRIESFAVDTFKHAVALEKFRLYDMTNLTAMPALCLGDSEMVDVLLKNPNEFR